ncbi:MAG: DUF2442 domain-containing protein [Candidatus Delongbacteria bacterium]|nr:DUF2442 domain-containing protein [Candidatus Delongbacteria bacterium]
MYKSIIKVKPLSDYRLIITFEGGEVKVFDVKPYLETGIFKQLKNIDLFNAVKVSFDTVAWSNGADLDPEEIYEMSVAVTGVAEETAPYGRN